MSKIRVTPRGTEIVRKPITRECRAKNITEVFPAGCKQGQRCLIVGGGPSLSDFDWRWLDGENTIGINKAFTHYPVDINYGMDYTFFDLLQYTTDPSDPSYGLHRAWMSFEGYKVFARQEPKFVFVEGVYYVNVLSKKYITFDLEKGIYIGNNSGVGALCLAVALGYQNIGLLGYDFKVQGSKTHWHDGYQFQDWKSLSNNLDRYRACIEELAETLEKLGVNVVNLSSDSNLSSYPRSDIKTFLGTAPCSSR